MVLVIVAKAAKCVTAFNTEKRGTRMFDQWQKQAEHESEGTGINGVLKTRLLPRVVFREKVSRNVKWKRPSVKVLFAVFGKVSDFLAAKRSTAPSQRPHSDFGLFPMIPGGIRAITPPNHRVHDASLAHSLSCILSPF